MGRVIHDGDGPSKDNFAGQPTVRATNTAKYVQSFDEIAVRTEEPSPHDPLVPRGSPKRDPKEHSVGTPSRLQGYDHRQNTRADPKTYFRDTPQSAKEKQDKRPDRLGRYHQQAGEDIS